MVDSSVNWMLPELFSDSAAKNIRQTSNGWQSRVISRNATTLLGLSISRACPIFSICDSIFSITVLPYKCISNTGRRSSSSSSGNNFPCHCPTRAESLVSAAYFSAPRANAAIWARQRSSKVLVSEVSPISVFKINS